MQLHVYALRTKIEPFSMEIIQNGLIKPENDRKFGFWRYKP